MLRVVNPPPVGVLGHRETYSDNGKGERDGADSKDIGRCIDGDAGDNGLNRHYDHERLRHHGLSVSGGSHGMYLLTP